jgi:hypothetical protein
MVLEVTVESGADAIVSFGIQVARPRDFLLRLQEEEDTMSTMSLRLPDSLHERAREVAKREGTSINQLIATALAEKLSALDTVAYLEQRGVSGSRQDYLRALRRVQAGEPQRGDEPVG